MTGREFTFVGGQHPFYCPECGGLMFCTYRDPEEPGSKIEVVMCSNHRCSEYHVGYWLPKMKLRRVEDEKDRGGATEAVDTMDGGGLGDLSDVPVQEPGRLLPGDKST